MGVVRVRAAGVGPVAAAVAVAVAAGVSGCTTLRSSLDGSKATSPGRPGIAAGLLAILPGLRSDHEAAVRSRPKPRIGGALDASSVRGRMVQVATREWKFFGGAQWRLDRPSIQAAGLEHQPGYRERVIRYWAVGLGRKVSNTRRLGWSGAFISFVLKEAGAKSRFPYSGTHTTYIARAIGNRKAGRLDAPIVGYRPGEYAPRPGDMVCNALTSGVDYDHIGRRYSAHCDVVVARGFRRVDVIGGNLTNAVRKRSLQTDEKGFVYPNQPRRIDPYVKRWFVILKVNM